MFVGFPEWTAQFSVRKTTVKDSSEPRAIACQNCAAYSVFPSGMTSHGKIAQFNWECIGQFRQGGAEYSYWLGHELCLMKLCQAALLSHKGKQASDYSKTRFVSHAKRTDTPLKSRSVVWGSNRCWRWDLHQTHIVYMAQFLILRSVICLIIGMRWMVNPFWQNSFIRNLAGNYCGNALNWAHLNF
jgi:hypothetical protein